MGLGVGRGWELQLFALLWRFQPQRNLQLSLIPLNFVRPVTPKVAGSSPVVPAISITSERVKRVACWNDDGGLHGFRGVGRDGLRRGHVTSGASPGGQGASPAQ